MLGLNDLNVIVKHYAYALQQRIDELDRLPYPHDPPTPQHTEFISVVGKFGGYLTQTDKEARLARKLH